MSAMLIANNPPLLKQAIRKTPPKTTSTLSKSPAKTTPPEIPQQKQQKLEPKVELNLEPKLELVPVTKTNVTTEQKKSPKVVSRKGNSVGPIGKAGKGDGGGNGGGIGEEEGGEGGGGKGKKGSGGSNKFVNIPSIEYPVILVIHNRIQTKCTCTLEILRYYPLKHSKSFTHPAESLGLARTLARTRTLFGWD